MSANAPKTINVLMRHLRDDCGINISGSTKKLMLVNYGYYHGYKGYRFFNRRANTIPYTDFDQLVNVIEYDQSLKSALYSSIMLLEMTSKNIVLNKVATKLNDASFDAVYKEVMNDEQSNSNLRLKRLQLKDRIHSTLSKNYSFAMNSARKRHSKSSHEIMVSHFYNRGDEVPIWAIFEVISLGDFATFCTCINAAVRKEVLESIDMLSSTDTNYQLLSNIIFTVKSLRNAVAHNNVIFDARFKDRDENNNVVSWITAETGITGIKFNFLTDYLVLICVVLKKMKCNIADIVNTIDEYTKCINIVYHKLPTNIYTKIVSTDSRPKISDLKDYILKK